MSADAAANATGAGCPTAGINCTSDVGDSSGTAHMELLYGANAGCILPPPPPRICCGCSCVGLECANGVITDEQL